MRQTPIGADAAAAEELRRRAHAGLVERPQLVARGNSSRPPTSRTNSSGTMRSGFTQK